MPSAACMSCERRSTPCQTALPRKYVTSLMLPNRIGAIAVEKYSRQRREPWRESVVEECEHPPHPPVGWVFLSARPGELPPQLAGLWLFGQFPEFADSRACN